MLGGPRRRIAALVFAFGLVGTALVGACADKKGALMLAVNTDMKAPKDVNAVSITISTNGAIKHSFIGRVTPQGEVLLPATLAIVEPEDKSASIRIRVMAFQERKARVLRDVRTTVPSGGRTALLRIPLNFASDASAVGEPLPPGLIPAPIPGTGGTTSSGGTSSGGTSGDNPGGGAPVPAEDYDFFGSFQPPCPDIQNQTIIDGDCKDNYVDPETLPDFDQGELGDSTDQGSCFDVAKCFTGAVGVGGGDTEPARDAGAEASTSNPDGGDPPADDAGAKFKDFVPAAVTLDRNTCSLQLNGANPSRLNLALVTPDTGECVRDGECYVPIDRAPGGWRDDGNGRVQLPSFVCRLLSGKNLRLATSTETCPAKEEKNPICTPKAAGSQPGGPCAFEVGAPLDPTTASSAAGLAAAQAVSDFAGSAAAAVDGVTDRCRKIAQDLQAPGDQQSAAEANADKKAKMQAWCALAVSAIGSTKAMAGGTLLVDAKPRLCHLLVSEKAACQGKCSGAPCDIKANPFVCTGGSLIVECSGQCTSSAGASLKCEGACTGACQGSCMAPGGVECIGTCSGGACTASPSGSGLQADGTCRGSCKGTCSATAPGAMCAGTCDGDCSGSCNATAQTPAKCDGQCAAELKPLYCDGGRLEGGCKVDARCDQACDVTVAAKAECTPPNVFVTTSGAADMAAADRLSAALAASFGPLLAFRAKMETMLSVAQTLATIAGQATDVNPGCTPALSAAFVDGQNNAAAALMSTVTVTSAVGGK